MSLEEDGSFIYAFYNNDQISTENSLDDKIYRLPILDYINNLSKSIKAISEKQNEITKKLKSFNLQINKFSIEKDTNKFNLLNQNLQYLKNNIPHQEENTFIDLISKITDKSNNSGKSHMSGKLNNSTKISKTGESNLPENIPGNQEVKIKDIIEYSSNFINFIKTLRETNFNLFFVLNNISTLLSKYLKDTEKPRELNSCLIDQEQRPILVLSKKESESPKKQIFKILSYYLSTYKEKIIDGEIFIEEAEFLKQETNDFFSKISNSINEVFNEKSNKIKNCISLKMNEQPFVISKNYFYKNYFMNNISNYLESFLNGDFQINSIINLNLNSIDLKIDSFENCFISLICAIQNHFPQRGDRIITNYDTIFRYYYKYIGTNPIHLSYEEFLKVCNCEIKPDEDIREKVISLIEKLQNENKYFYLDVLFQIVLKNILNPEILTKKYLKVTQIDNNENKTRTYESQYTEISEKDRFDDLNFKFCYDKEFKFIFKIDYSNNESCEREIKIFSENYSKFVIHKIDEFDKKVIIPYFPLGTIESIILPSNSENDKQRFEFTLVDMIVIILEISTALKELHSKESYHGNLTSNCVLINSKKDAYLCGFSYNFNDERLKTRLGNDTFSHSPEMQKLIDSQENINIKDYQSNDIFSFGVVTYELITGVCLYKKFEKNSKDEKKGVLSLYNNLLFDEKISILFDNSFDINGNSLIGMKEIIKKCLEASADNRYSSFDEIINMIKILPIYIKNSEEIEFRFNNAINSADYRCTISDIVESYFRGQSDSFTDIQNILSTFKKKRESTDESIKSKDIITQFFEAFAIDYDEDYLDLFNDIFIILIQKSIFLKFDRNYYGLGDKLFSLSIKSNSISETTKFIFPICSLEGFIKENKYRYSRLICIWPFLLAKELSEIHSIGAYHGELSSKTIGIYYNNETKTFVPSIILFYSFYKQVSRFQDESSRIRYSSDDNTLIQNQESDIDAFIEVLSQMLTNDATSKRYLNGIENLKTMNSILLHLNNEYQKQYSQFKAIYLENVVKYKYKYFALNFPIIKELFIKIQEQKEINQIDDMIFDFESILSMISDFLDMSSSNKNLNLAKTLSEMKRPNAKKEGYEVINSQFEQIRRKCSSLFIEIIESAIEEGEEEETDQLNNEIQSSESISDDKIDLLYLKRSKKRKWFHNEVPRSLEICELDIRACKFLIERYFFGLNPQINFKISIKIINRKFSKYQNDSEIKADDIKELLCKYNINDVKNESGLVVVKIKESPNK